MSETQRYLTGISVKENGDSEWVERSCGCGYAVDKTGSVFVKACDGHEKRDAKEYAQEDLMYE